MTCGSCSASIEAALKRCKEISVEEAIVYWETGEAKIRVSIRLSDEANNIRSLVCETVENAGFDVLEEFEETEAGVIKEKLVRAATITTSTTSSSSLSSEFPLLQFTIDGMTCSSCVESVQNCLRTLPGIQLLQVTLLPVGSATVKLLDPSLIDAGDIKEAIEDAGFLVISTSSAVVEPVVAKTSEGTSGGGVVDAAEASTAHHIITKPVATNHHLPSSTGGSSSSSDSLIDFGVHSSNNNSSLVHRPLTPEINTLLSSTSLSSRTAAFKEGGAAAVAVAVLAVDGMTCNVSRYRVVLESNSRTTPLLSPSIHSLV